MSVTMKDIAREVGVSVVTVSKAFRSGTDIGEKTRKQILDTARRLRYRPNLTARSLVTGKSYVVGMVIPDLLHPFFAEIAKAISQTLRKHGYSLILTSSEEDSDLQAREIDQLLGRRLDALVIASVTISKDQFRHINEQGTPYVLIDRPIPGLPSNFVGIDDAAMGAKATEHLIHAGCRKIAHIAASAQSSNRLREQGYRSALTNHGRVVDPQYIVSGKTMDVASREQGYLAMQQLLALDAPPDGVFCFNDPLALGAIACILKAGLRIPEDIAVIGCGNLNFDDYLGVPLSSMDQKTERIGECTARLLLELMELPGARKNNRTFFEAELVQRTSTRRTRDES